MIGPARPPRPLTPAEITALRGIERRLERDDAPLVERMRGGRVADPEPAPGAGRRRFLAVVVGTVVAVVVALLALVVGGPGAMALVVVVGGVVIAVTALRGAAGPSRG